MHQQNQIKLSHHLLTLVQQDLCKLLLYGFACVFVVVHVVVAVSVHYVWNALIKTDISTVKAGLQ